MSEKETQSNPVPSEQPPKARWRAAFWVHAATVVLPAVALTVLPIVAGLGLCAAAPAIGVGLGILGVTVFGALLVKAIEDWESRPPELPTESASTP